MQKDAETLPHSTPIRQEALSVTHPYRSQRMAAGLKSVLDVYGATPEPVLMAAVLGSQHSVSHMPPGTAQATTHYETLCSSYQIFLGQAQEVADQGLYWRPSQEAPEPTYLENGFRT